MVFQDYALFPHLSVFDNVAYGLKVRKWPRRKIEERVMESLALVRLEAFANRMPRQLSGASSSGWRLPGHWRFSRLCYC